MVVTNRPTQHQLIAAAVGLADTHSIRVGFTGVRARATSIRTSLPAISRSLRRAPEAAHAPSRPTRNHHRSSRVRRVRLDRRELPRHPQPVSAHLRQLSGVTRPLNVLTFAQHLDPGEQLAALVRNRLPVRRRSLSNSLTASARLAASRARRSSISRTHSGAIRSGGRLRAASATSSRARSALSSSSSGGASRTCSRRSSHTPNLLKCARASTIVRTRTRSRTIMSTNRPSGGSQPPSSAKVSTHDAMSSIPRNAATRSSRDMPTPTAQPPMFTRSSATPRRSKPPHPLHSTSIPLPVSSRR